MDHEDIKSLVERQAKHKSCTKLYHFNLRSHDLEDMIIGEGSGSRPLQYLLGKLHTMPSINEKQGSGWDKIVKEMFDRDTWEGVNGKTHNGPRLRTWKSLTDCIELHKLTQK